MQYNRKQKQTIDTHLQKTSQDNFVFDTFIQPIEQFYTPQLNQNLYTHLVQSYFPQLVRLSQSHFNHLFQVNDIFQKKQIKQIYRQGIFPLNISNVRNFHVNYIDNFEVLQRIKPFIFHQNQVINLQSGVNQDKQFSFLKENNYPSLKIKEMYNQKYNYIFPFTQPYTIGLVYIEFREVNSVDLPLPIQGTYFSKLVDFERKELINRKQKFVLYNLVHVSMYQDSYKYELYLNSPENFQSEYVSSFIQNNIQPIDLRKLQNQIQQNFGSQRNIPVYEYMLGFIKHNSYQYSDEKIPEGFEIDRQFRFRDQNQEYYDFILKDTQDRNFYISGYGLNLDVNYLHSQDGLVYMVPIQVTFNHLGFFEKVFPIQRIVRPITYPVKTKSYDEVQKTYMFLSDNSDPLFKELVQEELGQGQSIDDVRQYKMDIINSWGVQQQLVDIKSCQGQSLKKKQIQTVQNIIKIKKNNQIISPQDSVQAIKDKVIYQTQVDSWLQKYNLEQDNYIDQFNLKTNKWIKSEQDLFKRQTFNTLIESDLIQQQIVKLQSDFDQFVYKVNRPQQVFNQYLRKINSKYGQLFDVRQVYED